MITLETKGARSLFNKTLGTVPLEIKLSSDTPGLFTGYGSVFGVKDCYDDIVAAGAFANSLSEWKSRGEMPAMLWQHDQREPIGLWTDMTEDDRGLRCTGTLLLTVPEGQKAYEHLRAGTVKGLSIGFRAVERSWNYDTEVRTLTQVDLFEVSLVTIPANRDAQVDGVKAEGMTIREFEEFLRDEGGFSHTRARQIAEHGFKAASRAPRDEGGGLDELLASIKGATKALTTRA